VRRGTPPYYWTSSDLPQLGLELASEGFLTGPDTDAGDMWLTLLVTDSEKAKDSATFRLTVSSA